MTGGNTKADARVTIEAIDLRFIVFPFVCDSKCSVVFLPDLRGKRACCPQKFGSIRARNHFAPPTSGVAVFQMRIAHHPPSTKSIVPQKPGHQTGMPGFTTRPGWTKKSKNPWPAIPTAASHMLFLK